MKFFPLSLSRRRPASPWTAGLLLAACVGLPGAPGWGGVASAEASDSPEHAQPLFPIQIPLTPASFSSASEPLVVPAPPPPTLQPLAVPLALPGWQLREQPGPSSLRGLWVDAFGPGLKTRAQIDQMVSDALKMGVNTLFVQAIRRGDCLCLRSGLPFVTDPGMDKDFDPLAYVLKQAQPRGLRVIAWASVTGVANAAVPSRAPGHILNRHGPGAGADSWLARRPDGSWQEGSDGWLDAGIPAAADYMASGVVNLVKNYPVDGVQLDRIRYPDGGAWGYDPKTLNRYRSETGAQGTPVPSDPQWQAWKRDQITALVRRIALEVKLARPDAWVSAATITYGAPPAAGDLDGFRKTRPYADVVQDWPTWMREGLIDLNVLMNYKRGDVAQQGQWFDGWNSFAASIRRRPDGAEASVAVGTALYLNPAPVSAQQAQRSVASGLGWVGYSYRTPTLDVYQGKQSTPQGLSSVGAALNAGEVLPAPLRWQEGVPSVRGLLGRLVGAAVPGGRPVEAWQGGALVARSVTDGNGYFGFLTLPPGPTEVRVAGQTWQETLPQVGVVRYPDLLLPGEARARAAKP